MNYAIYELVYGHELGINNRSSDYEQPDFAKVHQHMEERKNMTLVYLWGKVSKGLQRQRSQALLIPAVL